MSFDPTDIGWRIGRTPRPRGVELWSRYDRTAGVYGEQGSGKTLDVLAPALLAHRGAGLATLTKVDDLLLTAGWRGRGGRPIAVLDPFGAAPGMPELVWDPVAGCVDPTVAEKRAKAFAAGTVAGAVSGGRQDTAARFYAAETAKVLQGFLHAAALTGRTLEHLLEWVANPVAAEQPAEILRQHPHAARFWDGLLTGALHGSADTVGNTVTTVQQAMSLFFQPEIRARCVPCRGRPATDIVELIARRGTVYLLGRDDPYSSAAPLMTAVAEHVLDTALWAATTSPHGRLTPTFLACLDELPSTAPLPTLRVRGFVNANWPHPDGGKWPHLVNGVGGSAAGRTGAFAFYVSQVRTPLLHGLKTVVPPVDQGSAVGRGYGPAPHASRALRVPAGPASPALDPRVPAGPGQGKLRAGWCPARPGAPHRLGWRGGQGESVSRPLVALECGPAGRRRCRSR